MRKVYIDKIKIMIYFKDKSNIEVDYKNKPFRFIYHYGELPPNYIETLDFYDFCKRFGFIIKVNLFTHKEYCRFSKKFDFYYDDFDRCEIEHCYEAVENPSIDWLKSDFTTDELFDFLYDNLKQAEERKNNERSIM